MSLEYLVGQVVSVLSPILKDVINLYPWAKEEKNDVITAVVESSIIRSALVQSTSSVLTRTVNGSSILKSVADLASQTTGKSKDHMVVSKADNKVEVREGAMADQRVVARHLPKADNQVVYMVDHRRDQ